MLRFAFSTWLLLLLAAMPAQAADRKFDPDAAAQAVAPFLDDQTVAVLHVDLTRADVDRLFKQLAELMSLKPDELAEQKKPVAEAVKKLTAAGAKDLFVVVSLTDVSTGPPFLVVPLEKGGDAKALAEIKDVLKSLDPQNDAEQIGSAVVAGTAATRTRLKTLKPVARPEVAKGFAAIGDGLGQAVLWASPTVRKGIEKALPQLPPELGGGSIKVLTDGLQWMALKVETSPKVQISWITQAADKDAAKTLHDLIQNARKSLLDRKEIRELGPNFEKVLDGFTPRLDGDRLTLTLDETFTARFLAGVQNVREAATRKNVSNNLKQLGLALWIYHDATGRLPAVANFDKQNKPLLSWRVHALQYFDGEEGKLYKEFHLDEPWDSEHNKKLIAKMPKVFADPTNPKLAAEGKTTYLAPVHKDAVFTGDKMGLRLTDITDGTSNTVMLVVVDDADAVIWTKPDDLKLDPKNPAKSLSSRHDDKYLFVFADGSVRAVSKKIDKDTLWAIFTRAGGETVKLP